LHVGLVLRRGGPEHHLRRARGIVPENKGRGKKRDTQLSVAQHDVVSSKQA
jgi:hypothetical protein